jgi:fatty acid CoA ligase FadD21
MLFAGMLASPAPGTPEGPWLRTGDLGFFSEGEIFIVGRMKDLLIVYGRNHYPEDIESTVEEITGGRIAAVSVPVDETEKLVTIIEMKKRGDSDEEVREKLGVVKNDVTAAVSKSHGLNVADLVLVPPGYHLARFRPPRAARFGGPPVSSSTAGGNSPGWTPRDRRARHQNLPCCSPSW